MRLSPVPQPLLLPYQLYQFMRFDKTLETMVNTKLQQFLLNVTCSGCGQYWKILPECDSPMYPYNISDPFSPIVIYKNQQFPILFARTRLIDQLSIEWTDKKQIC